MARGSLDDRTVERLLSGQIGPEDAPPGYQRVSELVIAALAPSEACELAQEASVVAMAAATAQAVSSSETTAVHRLRLQQRRTIISKVLSAKAAALVTVAVGAGTAAAAASGNLPGLAWLTSGSHVSGPVPTSTTSSTASTPGVRASHSVSLQALSGLCTAYLAQHSTGTSTSPGDQSTSFKALVAAHGGDTGTWTFCTQSNTHHSGEPGGKSTSSTASVRATTSVEATTSVPVTTPNSQTKGEPSRAAHDNPSSMGHHPKAGLATPKPGGTKAAGSSSRGVSDHGTSSARSGSHGPSSAGSTNSASHAHQRSTPSPRDSGASNRLKNNREPR